MGRRRQAVLVGPADVCGGRQIDSIEIAHNHLCRDTILATRPTAGRATEHVIPIPRASPNGRKYIYFHLLECGLRIPPDRGQRFRRIAQSGRLQPRVRPCRGRADLREVVAGVAGRPRFRDQRSAAEASVEGELPGHVFQGDAGKTWNSSPHYPFRSASRSAISRSSRTAMSRNRFALKITQKAESCRKSPSTKADGS